MTATAALAELSQAITRDILTLPSLTMPFVAHLLHGRRVFGLLGQDDGISLRRVRATLSNSLNTANSYMFIRLRDPAGPAARRGRRGTS